MRLRTLAFAVLAPLALAACGGGEPAEGGAAATSEPVAKIAAPAGTSWAETVSVTPEGGYRMGNPDAPIKLVEFASITCAHCAEFAETGFKELRDEYVASGRVSLELRNFVRDPIDVTAAMLTRCGPPESYFALTEQMFANQQALFDAAQRADLQTAASLPENQRFVALGEALGLIDFFAARGVSRDQARTCLAKGETAQALAQSTQAQAKEYNLQGTPSFLINGKLAGVSSWSELEPLLQSAGAR